MRLLTRCMTVCGWLLAVSAQAHVVLADPQAVAGSYYKATMRVGHGCNGSATVGIRVQVPAGFQGAKPQPKAGWVLSTRKAKLTQPYVSHGKTVTDDVVEISWQAATPDAALPDDFYDEFAWMSRVPEQAGPVWVKVLQTCVQGQNSWTDIPTNGTSTKGMKTPAALLTIEPAAVEHHHH
jgi:periplasmic copper chaperone A